MKEYNENTLPKWAQTRLRDLRQDIKSLQGLKQLHGFLADDERDWFVLPDPINGCSDDKMSLWLLHTDRPFPVCTLYKGDKLFIGRATKARYGISLVNS